jgi:hypothetical protein
VKRTKWEYHVLIRDLLDERASVDAFAEVRALGEHGWELVSVHYLTAYAPSLEPPRVEAPRLEEDDVIGRVRKRLNGTLSRMGSTNGLHETNGGARVDVAAPPEPRIDALPEARLEAWFKRPLD